MKIRPATAQDGDVVELNEPAIEQLPIPGDSITVVTATLRALVGERLTARIAGVDEPKDVDDWAAGRRWPHAAAARRLHEAWRVADYLLREEDRDTVRAWFLGLNPELGDRIPVLAIAEDPDQVMRAARAFVAEG